MKRNYIILSVIVLSLVALDQLTKQLIASTMNVGESITLLEGFLSIASHRNQGGAWGIFYGEMTIFYIITIGAGVLFYFLTKDINFNTKRLYSIAIALMIAGGVGNFIDRLIFKEVIDFIDFIIFGYDFPTFNVADICLVIGVIIFAIDVLFEDVIKKWKK